MPSYLDLAVLGIVLVSALLSMMRGFTREVLAIASWAAAAAAAYYFYPMLMPYLTPYIHKEIIAQAAAAAHCVLRHVDRRVAVHGSAVRRDPRQQDRRPRPVAGLRVRRRERVSPCRRRLRHLQLAGLGEAATGMGQERQDAAGPHRDRRSNRRHAADGRGPDDQRLDPVARERGDERLGADKQRRRFAPEDRGRSIDRDTVSAAEKSPIRTPEASSGSPMDKQKLDALINKNAPFAPAPKQ